MSEFTPGLCHPVFTSHRGNRASQLSETASNFSHCSEMPIAEIAAASAAQFDRDTS
jgi:hypothetical protein